jgi:hypothetical protein
MKSNLFIPKKLLIGFQERTDTFTGKLAYVIYYDEKNKLRKEGSWNSWRDRDIETLEVDNSPTTGFTLNKGFTRYSDWGSGRAVIRIWDPRDFEFEIALDNLVGILMHSNVSKREIDEKCVFAWNGTELVLLPCNTEEYKSSVEYTDKQAKTFSARALTPGHTYVPKKDDKPVIYLGRYDKYVSDVDYNQHTTTHQLKDKKHWFIEIDGKEAFHKEPAAYLASCHIDEVHTDYAASVEGLHSTALVQRIVDYKEEPFVVDPDLEFRNLDGIYIKHSDGVYSEYRLSCHLEVKLYQSRLIQVKKDGTLMADFDDRSSNYYYYNHPQRKRTSSFGLTTYQTIHPADIILAKTKAYSAWSLADEEKRVILEGLRVACQQHPLVTLKWVLENGKTTKGLNYEY